MKSNDSHYGYLLHKKILAEVSTRDVIIFGGFTVHRGRDNCHPPCPQPKGTGEASSAISWSVHFITTYALVIVLMIFVIGNGY